MPPGRIRPLYSALAHLRRTLPQLAFPIHRQSCPFARPKPLRRYEWSWLLAPQLLLIAAPASDLSHCQSSRPARRVGLLKVDSRREARPTVIDLYIPDGQQMRHYRSNASIPSSASVRQESFWCAPWLVLRTDVQQKRLTLLSDCGAIVYALACDGRMKTKG